MQGKIILSAIIMSAAWGVYAQSADGQDAPTEFKTPSGNIVCSGDEGGLSCYVKERDGEPALPQPPDCRLSWGGFFHLPAEGKVEMKCVGDYPFARTQPVLPYNETVRNGSWRCVSRQDGLYCTNLLHHGFLLNRKEQIVF